MSTTGGGISTALIDSDGAHLQRMVDFIDNKGAFFYALQLEVPDQVVTSVQEVRKMATATKSAVESEEAAEIAHEVEEACREFCRDFNPGRPNHPADDSQLLEAQLIALRVTVNRAVAFAVLVFAVAPPKNLDLSDTDVSTKTWLAYWNSI